MLMANLHLHAISEAVRLSNDLRSWGWAPRRSESPVAARRLQGDAIARLREFACDTARAAHTSREGERGYPFDCRSWALGRGSAALRHSRPAGRGDVPGCQARPTEELVGSVYRRKSEIRRMKACRGGSERKREATFRLAERIRGRTDT